MNTHQNHRRTEASPKARGPILITGATGGLGYETALSLASHGDSLIFCVRDLERGQQIANEICEKYPRVSVIVEKVNIASLSSVSRLVGRLCESGNIPATIICNAGIQIVNGVQVSEDGFELTMATNVLGHVSLIAHLLPHLRPSTSIITIGSETHRGGLYAFGFPAADWNGMANHLNPGSATDSSSRGGRVRYSTSKLACIVLAYELNRLFSPRGIHAVAFDPGLMPATGLARDYPAFIKRIYAGLVPLLTRFPGANSVSRSGSNLAWLVHHAQENDLFGRYVSNRFPHKSSRESYTPGIGSDVWTTCCLAAGIDPSGL
ncbi:MULTISPECIES: SDR family NAD(P)-dependent oxidoreductase [Rothia]|uniref:SDR family NAD(P)-dependent oxidoreductase n=1 Tax=Rothia TaxID=32207 RepID=UPI0009F639F8